MKSRLARRARMAVLASGLLAATVLVTPTATADTGAGGATARLAAADSAVLAADVAGTAWYTDTASGKLVVTVDRTVSGSEIATIRQAVRSDDLLEIRRTPGTLAPRGIAGGDSITSGGVRCTVGFNVRDSAGDVYALTAGHCTNIGATWSIGTRFASSFPGNDYGFIRYTDPSIAIGGVRAGGGAVHDITGAGSPSVGQQACRSGSTTGMFCGTVTGLNATVNYGADGIVTGMIQTNLCAEPGDSGGPLWANHTAYGITSGGSGNCASGGVTFFQPVVEPLMAYNMTVL